MSGEWGTFVREKSIDNQDMTEKTERKKITARDFAELKGQRKLVCVTCYDYTSALPVPAHQNAN